MAGADGHTGQINSRNVASDSFVLVHVPVSQAFAKVISVRCVGISGTYCRGCSDLESRMGSDWHSMKMEFATCFKERDQYRVIAKTEIPHYQSRWRIFGKRLLADNFEISKTSKYQTPMLEFRTPENAEEIDRNMIKVRSIYFACAGLRVQLNGELDCGADWKAWHHGGGAAAECQATKGREIPGIREGRGHCEESLEVGWGEPGVQGAQRVPCAGALACSGSRLAFG